MASSLLLDNHEWFFTQLKAMFEDPVKAQMANECLLS